MEGGGAWPLGGSLGAFAHLFLYFMMSHGELQLTGEGRNSELATVLQSSSS